MVSKRKRERLDRIANLVRERGSLTIEDIMRLFDVGYDTARKYALEVRVFHPDILYENGVLYYKPGRRE